MADTVDLSEVWTAATDELADEIVSAQQRAYLRLTRLRAGPGCYGLQIDGPSFSEVLVVEFG